VGAELFHADKQTDMTKLIVAFRNFANAPKNVEEMAVECFDAISDICLNILKKPIKHLCHDNNQMSDKSKSLTLRIQSKSDNMSHDVRCSHLDSNH
jgi:hypothetical protein